jgi:hypothetical protein
MSAFGEILVLVFYIILSIPIIVLFTQVIRTKDKGIKNRRLIWTIISAIPLILYGYFQYASHHTAESEYIGIYELTEYPKCDSCKLELMTNNQYIVRNRQKIIEKGKWRYRSGGDYWIVDIGEAGQLGTGRYNYKENK